MKLRDFLLENSTTSPDGCPFCAASSSELRNFGKNYWKCDDCSAEWYVSPNDPDEVVKILRRGS